MELVVRFWKEIGETPLEALKRFQHTHPEYEGLKGTYAGRLDPAAEGELIFLFGEKVHEKEVYTGCSKTYTATFLFGVSTDTGDLLGVPVKSVAPVVEVSDEEIKKIIDTFSAVKEQIYPLYSSKTVAGKPLFVYARNDEAVVQPVRSMKIHSAVLEEQKYIHKKEVVERVEMLCQKVTGDFRQKEIMDGWVSMLPLLPDTILTLTFVLTVSSGTYIRALTETLEQELGVPSCLFSLVRTHIEK
jgi:tRNA pseudouridine(55) synthase